MDSELSLEEEKRIDEFLEDAASEGLKEILPSKIAEETQVDLPRIIRRLRELVVKGEVLAIYEIDCPNCDRSVKRTGNKSTFRKIEKCPYCGNAFEINEDDVWTSFQLKMSK